MEPLVTADCSSVFKSLGFHRDAPAIKAETSWNPGELYQLPLIETQHDVDHETATCSRYMGVMLQKIT